MVRCEQLENKNQFVIYDDKATYFQSYESVCACVNRKNQKLTLFKDWDYSNTTRKHLYIFIGRFASSLVAARVYYSKNKRQEIKKMTKEKLIKYAREEK